MAKHVLAALLGATVLASSARAGAAPGDAEARKGLTLARKGDCVAAVPLLEEAELRRHSPTTAFALAECYVALGDLVKASELFHAIAEETPARTWTRADRNAVSTAAKRAEELDARIPTLQIRVYGDYEDLEVTLDGQRIRDPERARQIPPNQAVVITARATGYRETKKRVVLNEGERHVLRLRLEREAPEPPIAAATQPGDEAEKRKGDPKLWLGGRYRGFVIPQFVTGLFGEGGRTIVAPGAGLTLATKTGNVDVVASLAYAFFRMPETPFKPNGTPDTEYEIIESDLQALFATVDLLWTVPLDSKGAWGFRIGGGAGIGWAFAGDLYRTQAYPSKDTGEFQKCKGPNDPAGSFRYCNQLDKDADRYGGYVEPSWFEGGARPLVFPWLALPEVGLSWRASPSFAMDLDLGLTLTGLMTSFGIRFGL